MDKDMIFNKFGQYYFADDITFLMGIDIRFADHLAIRMKDRVVLETCTGGGFSTIAMAKYANHVYTVEIDGLRIKDAKRNAEMDYTLSPRVKNIIARHMFPLTPVPPTCTEAWIVCIADKICAIEETIFGR